MESLLEGTQFYDRGFPVYLNRETEGFATPMHRHDFVEISLVLEGKGIHYIGDQVLETQKGDLYVIPVGAPHVFRPSSPEQSDPLVIMNLIFDLSTLERLKEWMPGDCSLYRQLGNPRNAEQTWVYHQDKKDRFLSLFTQAYTEYADRAAGYRTMVTALLLQILQLADRVLAEPQAPGTPTEPAPEEIDDAIHYIWQCYSGKITLKEAASRSYMSVGHFQNQFKKTTGVTFNHYVQHVRIQKCCQLLRTTDKSVQQTANEVGYTDMKFFHSLFKKITGSSPQQYRKA